MVMCASSERHENQMIMVRYERLCSVVDGRAADTSLAGPNEQGSLSISASVLSFSVQPGSAVSR